MTEKVVLPLGVANAIEKIRGEGLSNFGIITGMTTSGQGAFHAINQWSYQDECGNTDKVISALVNGYEVAEMNPDELKTTDIYLGLLSLAVDYDKHDWFLKAAAQAFKQKEERIFELWQELDRLKKMMQVVQPEENEKTSQKAEYCNVCGVNLKSYVEEDV